MKITQLLLQSVVAAAVVAVPLLAEAQPYPPPGAPGPGGPYGSGYPYVSSAYPMSFPSGAWQRALGGTPFDPQATTVRVVPPQGGTVMLYRNGSVRGWWMQPSMISVRPGQPYAIVATRGTHMLFNAAVVFHPGYTDIVWRGSDVPRIAYTPAWNYGPHGYGYGDAYATHRRAQPHGARQLPPAAHRSGSADMPDYGPQAQPQSVPTAATAATRAKLDIRPRKTLVRRSSNLAAGKADLRRSAPRRTTPSAARSATKYRATQKATRRAPSRLASQRAPARASSNDGIKKRIRQLAARRSQRTPTKSKKAIPKRSSPKQTKAKSPRTASKTMRVARTAR